MAVVQSLKPGAALAPLTLDPEMMQGNTFPKIMHAN
jgi:hypothetical protein